MSKLRFPSLLLFFGIYINRRSHLSRSNVKLRFIGPLSLSPMALRKTLAQRLLSLSRDSSPIGTLEHAPILFPSFQSLGARPNAAKSSFHRDLVTAPDPGEKGFVRRFLQRRGLNQSARIPQFLTIPVGEMLREKLKATSNISKDRLRLDGLSPPAPGGDSLEGLTVQEARKLLRLSQLEKLKSRFRQTQKNSVSYSEFLKICIDGCSNRDQGVEYAKMLDESGNVIVLGNIVFLWPEQVARSMEAIICQTVASPNDPRRMELDQMEKQKAAIDKKAQALVQGELYCGLGFILLQTLGFMRLTFWELSWDVMEPICFFVTSLHFAAGYAFFLRTSSEPSFEGYFQRRFKTKQKRLMKAHAFDIERYDELRRACYANSYGSTSSDRSSSFNHATPR